MEIYKYQVDKVFIKEKVMEQNKEVNLNWLIYLGACYVHGWEVSKEGYDAFMDQIERGFRNFDGTLYSKED